MKGTKNKTPNGKTHNRKIKGKPVGKHLKKEKVIDIKKKLLAKKGGSKTTQQGRICRLRLEVRVDNRNTREKGGECMCSSVFAGWEPGE